MALKDVNKEQARKAELDAELAAVQVVDEALSGLKDDQSRMRVLEYCRSRVFASAGGDPRGRHFHNHPAVLAPFDP